VLLEELRLLLAEMYRHRQRLLRRIALTGSL